MSAYGIDQMVLRAEIVAPEVKPAAIVLSFIADDVRRAEMKRVWGAEKPYFELVDGAAGRAQRAGAAAARAGDDARYLAAPVRLVACCVDTVLRAQGWQYKWYDRR